MSYFWLKESRKQMHENEQTFNLFIVPFLYLLVLDCLYKVSCEQIWIVEIIVAIEITVDISKVCYAYVSFSLIWNRLLFNL